MLNNATPIGGVVDGLFGGGGSNQPGGGGPSTSVSHEPGAGNPTPSPASPPPGPHPTTRYPPAAGGGGNPPNTSPAWGPRYSSSFSGKGSNATPPHNMSPSGSDAWAAPSPTALPPPSNTQPDGGHRKGLSLAAIGGVLGFFVVSALFWAVWLWLRKRHCTPIPCSASASVAGAKDENPFKHPRDEEEDDPFDAASLWRRSPSTLSVEELSHLYTGNLGTVVAV
ncbi:hypothetical protein AURDEDRAFT_129076 [Auricularia subglabra TFB-10046 SS5]|nr:hypothetical protein AURDEDRAFT_129076 [Auricularia subglabra TFB-10046 SS5]